MDTWHMNPVHSFHTTSNSRKQQKVNKVIRDPICVIEGLIWYLLELPTSPCLLFDSDAKDLDQATAELLANYKELSERHKAVVERNQVLEHECNDLQDIVKSYEENIQVITGKLRSHTVTGDDETLDLDWYWCCHRFLLLKDMSSWDENMKHYWMLKRSGHGFCCQCNVLNTHK